jgi:hypothetical protein
MKSARRGVTSGKFPLRFGDWLADWFAPARRRTGRRQAAACGHHRAIFEALEDRRVLSATLTSLASFPNYGANPSGGVVEDSTGNLLTDNWQVHGAEAYPRPSETLWLPMRTRRA